MSRQHTRIPARNPQGSRRPIYSSVDEMLSMPVLTELEGQLVTDVGLLPFHSSDGKSGSHLLAVEVVGGQRYVLKRISWWCDVVMRLTGDRAGRAVTIWQKGLLDRMPPQIVHGLVGCARDRDGWAILLEDFRGLMLPAHEQRLSEQQDALVLDAMAALHQTFWEEPPAPGTYSLCPLRTMYESLFPHTLCLETLHADISPFIAAMERYPQTLVHGDWHHGNVGIHPGRGPSVILLDWSLVGIGPPAVDLTHYIFIGVMRLPSTKEATIERYRRFLARRLGGRFDDARWVPQLELALLGEFLRLGWNKAQVAVHGETDSIRERECREIAWWCEQVRRPTRWL